MFTDGVVNDCGKSLDVAALLVTLYECNLRICIYHARKRCILESMFAVTSYRSDDDSISRDFRLIPHLKLIYIKARWP